MFENLLIHTRYGEVNISRIIASYTYITGKDPRQDPKNFVAYLVSAKISDEDQKTIWRFASNGKLELEDLARNFA